MPTNEEILNELDSQLLKEIRKLAGYKLAPSDIAVKLGINKAGFMRIWRDDSSMIRQEYEAGRLDIKVKKAKALKKEVKVGNITAIQIQEKHDEESAFEAHKREIFGLE